MFPHNYHINYSFNFSKTTELSSKCQKLFSFFAIIQILTSFQDYVLEYPFIFQNLKVPHVFLNNAILWTHSELWSFAKMIYLWLFTLSSFKLRCRYQPVFNHWLYSVNYLSSLQLTGLNVTNMRDNAIIVCSSICHWDMLLHFVYSS